MDLWQFLSNIGTIATIETKIKDVIKDYSAQQVDNKLNKIDTDFKQHELSTIQDLYIEEKIDGYIAKYSSYFKQDGVLELFSDTNRKKAIQQFYTQNMDLKIYSNDITPMLNRYFDELSNLLNRKLTFDSKIIINNMDKSHQEILHGINSLSSKLEKNNVYIESSYSYKIIENLNSILSLIFNNTGINLKMKFYSSNYLIANNLDDALLRLNNYFKSIDKDKIFGITKIETDSELKALHTYIVFLSGDYALELNDLFYKRIEPVITCCNEFEQKNNNYYLAIGAMGLYHNNSDENIFTVIMSRLVEYLYKVIDVLESKWKYRDDNKYNEIITKEMHSQLMRQMQEGINEDNRLLIYEILSAGKVNDIELAGKFNITVSELRHKLYQATKIFLWYEWAENNSTILYVRGQYIDTLKYYLNGGDGKNEI